jgi:hypothetical protein
MVTSEIKDRIEKYFTDEEIINYRLQKITRQIKLEQQKEIKQKKYELDPYFDSIKNWCPI